PASCPAGLLPGGTTMKLRDVFLAVPLVAGLAIAGAAAAAAQGLQLFASMFGGNEIAGGDPDGFGAATITFHGKTGLCFGIVVNGLKTPNGAHIHRGIAGVNGGIVVPLTAPTTGNPGASSGCVTIDSTLMAELRNSPSDFYVNI